MLLARFFILQKKVCFLEEKGELGNSFSIRNLSRKKDKSQIKSRLYRTLDTPVHFFSCPAGPVAQHRTAIAPDGRHNNPCVLQSVFHQEKPGARTRRHSDSLSASFPVSPGKRKNPFQSRFPPEPFFSSKAFSHRKQSVFFFPSAAVSSEQGVRPVSSSVPENRTSASASFYWADTFFS